MQANSPHNLKDSLPPLVLRDSQLPQLRSWKVGNTYRLVLEVEQISLDAPSPSSFNDSQHWTARFQIKSVKPLEGESATIDEKSTKAEALKRLQY